MPTQTVPRFFLGPCHRAQVSAGNMTNIVFVQNILWGMMSRCGALGWIFVCLDAFLSPKIFSFSGQQECESEALDTIVVFLGSVSTAKGH